MNSEMHIKLKWNLQELIEFDKLLQAHRPKR